MPVLRKATGTPSPPLPDSAPGWTPGLARCGAGPRRLCSHAGRVLRFRRPPGGGRRASSLNASDARRRIAPDGRFPCSESASRRLFLAASGLAAVGGLAVLNVRPRRHAPCLALFHPLPSIPPSAFCTAHTRRLPAARRNSHSQNGFVSELRRARLLLFLLPYVCKPRSRLRPGHAVARAEQRTAKPVPGPPGSPRAPARSGRPVLPAGARKQARSGVEGAQPAEWRSVISRRSSTIRPSWIGQPSPQRPRGRESVSRRQTELPRLAGRPAQAGSSCRQESGGTGNRQRP